MRNWALAATILVLPAAVLCQERRTFRPSASSRPATRPVPVSRRPAPAAQSVRSARPAVAHIPAAGKSATAVSGTSPGQGKGLIWSERFKRDLWGGKAAAARTMADDPPTPAPPAPQEPAPYYYTPGALIRSEGLGYTTKATDDARTHVVEAGYKIGLEEDKALTLNPHRGAHYGPPDKLPPPNPGMGGDASGRNAITPNTVTSGNGSGN